ncbi:MAG TPA: TPM domain-containing protein [Bacteroidota bacterium]|nr:TPM domain-containing protein [Bacteroidota bacterium]
MQNAFMSMFPAPEQEKIAAAVAEAEKVTSGEIVPYVVGLSDHYEVAEWRGGATAGILAFALLSFARTRGGDWSGFDPVWIGLITLLAAGCAMLASRFIPVLRRLFAGRHLMTRRVEQRAAQAFMSEEVFATPGRTGILIFLSMLERRVVVIGDAGIHSKVRQEEWQGIIESVVRSIRQGKPADGLVDAIRRCGALLAAHGLGRVPGSKDEIADNLRIRNE